MPQPDSTAADQHRATAPRIAYSEAPHDDPPPAGPQAVAAPASSAPAEEKPPIRDWPIIVYRDGGSIVVFPATGSSEPLDTPRELVLAVVDRAGRVRSTRCTCAFFGREGTCTHVWDADFELASKQGPAPS